MTLTRTVVIAADRGVPAHLFMPTYMLLAPELKRWLAEDPELGQVVIPTK